MANRLGRFHTPYDDFLSGRRMTFVGASGKTYSAEIIAFEVSVTVGKPRPEAALRVLLDKAPSDEIVEGSIVPEWLALPEGQQDE